ncbi:hypothetical protein [Myxococcus landrumensis]|uniref:Lipoprotein n=1 Tax=Myxococcus landrumensis TaxID=2813577 RepID=A0ABX7NFQ2_9BACT|nr:hypothetical protein [Myxococcus landrumus]QSQ17639.1 hypothetical protein JY572_17030 [Myxococcus landrumus]
MRTCRQGVVLALGMACGLGCLPDPVDVAGKRCDSREECGAGFLCQAGRCVSGGAVLDNLVLNPGFEQGVEGWVSTGSLTPVRPGFRGESAARLEVPLEQARVTLQPLSPPLLEARDSYYCASAWVRGPSGQSATLALLSDSEAQDPVSVSLNDTWQELKTSTLFVGDEAGSVRLTFVAVPGAALSVDEVRLWRAGSIFCEDGP